MSDKSYYKYYRTILLLLIFFLGISSFFANIESVSTNHWLGKIIDFFQFPNFYSSPIHILLWLGFVGVLFYSIFISDNISKFHKGFHIVVAGLIVFIIFEKSINTSYTINLKKDETARLSETYPEFQDSLSLRLVDFNIKQNQKNESAKNFISKLVLNENDSIRVSVNNPHKYKYYRFYQKSYRLLPKLRIKMNDSLFNLITPDTVNYKDRQYIIKPIDKKFQRFSIQSGQKKKKLQLTQTAEIGPDQIEIKDGKIIKESIIQITEVKGIRFLFFLFMLYLIYLGYIFWGNKNEC